MEYSFLFISLMGLMSLFYLHKSFNEIDPTQNIIKNSLDDQGVDLDSIHILYVHVSPGGSEMWENENSCNSSPDGSCPITTSQLTSEFDDYIKSRGGWYYDEEAGKRIESSPSGVSRESFVQ